MPKTEAERRSSSPSPSLDDSRILVVEDDGAIRDALVSGFRARGYNVDPAATGRSALALANEHPPDVVLLDLGLPDIDGLEVCRHLRRWTSNPIIVLTADGAEDRKVIALDDGADDYVTKPFSLPELHARVRVALRHRAMLRAIVDGEVLEVGALRLDVAGYSAVVNGATLDLQRLEFALLAELARNCGKVLTSRHLLARVWDGGESVGTLRTHVTAVRRKLGEGPGVPRIVTEYGVGYRMLGPGETLR